LSAREIECAEVHLVNVTQAVAGTAQPRHQLLITQPPLKRAVSEAAVAREKQVAPVRRKPRGKFPGAGVDLLAEVDCFAPDAVPAVADVKIIGARAVGPADCGKDQETFVG